MTIKEIKPSEVFANLAKEGTEVYCVDFGKVEILDLTGLMMGYIQRLLDSNSAKFFVVEGR